MRNIFLEKSYIGGEPSHSPFSEKSNLGISLDRQLVFIVRPSRGLPKYTEIKEV